MSTRILIECTRTLATNLSTGIPRVVRNVILHADRLQRELGIECVPVTLVDTEFYAARDDSRPALAGRFADWLVRLHHTATLPHGYRPLRDRLRKICYPKTPMRKLTQLAQQLSKRRIEFTDRDILLLLDASWHVPIWQAVQEARSHGCRVACVAYDLIPLEEPQFCASSLVNEMRDWFAHAAQHADYFIAISRHVSRQLEAYIGSSFPDIELPASRFDSFRLGADFSRTVTGRVRREIRELFAPDRGPAPYLTVGTLAPHKNHHFLLDAFDLVRASCPQTRLFIVGKPGWMCDDILRRIKQHPAYGSTLLLLTDLSDAELRRCYEDCRALVAPSRSEGFGLPLVESLHYGLPVLAGDTPIHREVGRQYCAYFDLANPAALATMVRNIEVDGNFPAVERPGQFEVTSWRDSCRELLTKTWRMSQQLPGGSSIPEGQIPLRHQAA